jgi:DNA polymerase elongation subunit (family B)
METDYRSLRNETKKQMKVTADAAAKAFLDGKQGAIKICMNSVYGQYDSDVSPLYDNVGPSVITCCSRFIIQNCRDNTVSGTVWLSPDRWAKFGATITQHIASHNDFATRTLVDPEPLLIGLTLDGEGFAVIEMPEVRLKYQDTDSNYVTMAMLDGAVVLPRYENDRRYVLTQIFGNFN